jgi:hypothetical protein
MLRTYVKDICGGHGRAADGLAGVIGVVTDQG